MAAEKTPKMVEIRDKSDDELVASLDRSKDELFRLQLKKHTNQLENVMSIRAKRREVARIMTILSARHKGLEVKKANASQAPASQAAKEQG